MVVPSAKVLHATGYYLTDDGDGEGAFSGVTREVSGPDLDHGRPDLELGGRGQGRNAHHRWAVAGVIWKVKPHIWKKKDCTYLDYEM